MDCIIKFIWDNEAQRWIAMSDDEIGFTLEPPSFDALVERIKLALPEIAEINCHYTGPIKLNIIAERFENLPSVA